LVNAKKNNRLPLRPSAQSNAPLITMTGEGGAVQLKSRQLRAIPPKQSHATGSAGPVKRRAGSLASGMKDRFTLPLFKVFFFFKGFNVFAPLGFGSFFS
jgi:hypothetical protein